MTNTTVPAPALTSSREGYPSTMSYSLVIPFYNEEESIRRVLTEACSAIQNLEGEHEVIAVDDGSSDSTLHEAELLKSDWPFLRILAFEKNRGQAAALLDGLRAARGRILITMDGDGQNDPSDIPHLLKILNERGSGMVAGVRGKRKDIWLRRQMSKLANAIRQSFLRDGVRDSGCALKVFTREVVESFIPIRTLYSFMPALAVGAGFQVSEMEVNHRPREKGLSKYGLLVMLWRPLVDMIGVWWFIQRRFQKAKPVDSAPR